MEDTWTQIRVKKDIRYELKRAAAEEGISMNQLLEDLLEKRTKQIEKDK